MIAAIDKFAPEYLTIGEYTFSLRKFREITGHDDSLPYTATLYANGRPVCDLFNDGWGGETMVTPSTAENSAYHEICDYLSEHGDEFVLAEMCNITLYYDNVSIIGDCLAENYSLRQEIERANKGGKAVAYKKSAGSIVSGQLRNVLPCVDKKGYTLVFYADGTDNMLDEEPEKQIV